MKKTLLILPVLFVFSVFLVFISCSNNKQNTTPQPTSTSQSNFSSQPNSNTNTTSKTFTLEQLKTYNGQNGNPAYVAVNGTVYDVTNARKWKNGKHEQGIVAGADLTNMMSKSPHGNSVLNGLPVVGTLK